MSLATNHLRAKGYESDTTFFFPEGARRAPKSRRANPFFQTFLGGRKFPPPSAGFWCGEIEFFKKYFWGGDIQNFREAFPGCREIEYFKKAFSVCVKIDNFKQFFPFCGEIEYFKKCFSGLERLKFSDKLFQGVERLNISKNKSHV